MRYRLLEGRNEPKISEIIEFIERTIRDIHKLMEEREKRLLDRLQALVNQSLSKEHYNPPYSCFPDLQSNSSQLYYYSPS